MISSVNVAKSAGNVSAFRGELVIGTAVLWLLLLSNVIQHGQSFNSAQVQILLAVCWMFDDEYL